LDPIAQLNTALAGRYRIERQLGEGGMANVYLARDLKHDRQVALKVLKPELAEALGAARFLAEVNTTANLQHPHILPLHDSGQAGEFLFYTMPYVEGETLRQRLDREGTLAEAAAVELAVDVAEALQLAHDRGIVHRDIKPSNILLSHGKALVADFGIARVSGAEAPTSLTELGSSIGTAGYMSPEQARGDDDVDHRADIYSLGCVLFEMLAGQPAHGGRTVLEMLARQASGPPPSVRAHRPEVAPALERSIAVALASRAADRFDSIAAFADAIRDSPQRDPAPDTAVSSIAVLPFVNRSSDPDDEFFSDGLTDEVITDLSRVSALRTISRNSSMALKGTTQSTRAIASELGITHLVTGTVRRMGPALRVTAELVEASTDTSVWSEKFAGTMEDVFGIQEEISRRIVAALEVRLSATEERDVAARPIEDPVAYECYLRACQLMYDWTPQAQTRAMQLVDQALGITGENATLLAMKGQLYWNMVNTGATESIESDLARAEELAARALAVEPDAYLAIFVRGLVASTRGLQEVGLVDLYRASALQPGDANVAVELNRFSLGAGLRGCKGRLDRALELDPLSPQAHLLMAMYHEVQGLPERGASFVRRAVELAPAASFLHIHAAWILGVGGAVAEARELLEGVREATPDPVAALAGFLSHALAGDEEAAMAARPQEMEQHISTTALCWRRSSRAGKRSSNGSRARSSDLPLFDRGEDSAARRERPEDAPRSCWRPNFSAAV
jgi:serine/threonine-protein kinase